jgi:hypothetical protein
MVTAKKTILGQLSWRIATKEVEAYITETGGHLGPVTFKVGARKITPYSVAPWAKEKLPPSAPPVIRALRGDFFCMPFGGNSTPFRGEKHPVHGEVANSKWEFESIDQGSQSTWLHLSLNTRVRRGHVDKRICLIKGHHALYCRHTISGMSGEMPLGHHAMIKFPDLPGSGIISTSPFVYGQTFYESTENPEIGGYSILKHGAVFESLKSVPLITGETTDLSRYPARRGFEDIAMVVADAGLPFAWTAVTFPKERFVWFALKDPRVLRNTVFWISNAGRHYAPWSGRHVNVMGLEEVTSYFHPGLAESAAENPISRMGYPTTVALDPRKPTTVNYIMAIAPIPAGFDEVKSIEPIAQGVQLTSSNGRTVQAVADVEFLQQS